jgi:hypothetical protein
MPLILCFEVVDYFDFGFAVLRQDQPQNRVKISH